jgi:hypothetical protein
MLPSVNTNHMGGLGFDIADGAMLDSCRISVAHQNYLTAIDTDDAVHHITATFHPSEYDITHLRLGRLLQDDTFLAADDKWQHAVSLDGKGNTHPILDQPDSLLYDDLVSHRLV